MKAIMGLEIHIQLLTKTKLFCSTPTDYEGKKPNENTCPICLGFPGTKPSINKKALDFGIIVAKALNCQILPKMFFSRKSYFYPDMSKNFQISQYEIPLALNGHLEVLNKKIGITRIHIEEDPAKLIHVGGDITTANYVLADYNRSGIPLLEIVTEPDFRSTKEVREFLRKLSSILEHLEVYDSSREGSLRVDANISLEGGERVEIKNITGFKNVEKALNYEITRQESLTRMGLKTERETRHFDAETKSTSSLRKKEFEEDYGYIFEPDLTEIEISKKWVQDLQKQMPELPDQRIKRLVKQYGITKYQTKVVVYTDKALVDFFENCCKIYSKPKKIIRWMITDLLKCLNWNRITIRESKVKPRTFVEFLRLIEKGKITERLGKEIIKEYVMTGESPQKIIKKKGLTLIEKDKLIKIIKNVIKTNPQAVKDYRTGEKKAMEYFIGQVLRKIKARADPNKIRKLIKELI